MHLDHNRFDANALVFSVSLCSHSTKKMFLHFFIIPGWNNAHIEGKKISCYANSKIPGSRNEGKVVVKGK